MEGREGSGTDQDQLPDRILCIRGAQCYFGSYGNCSV